MCVTAIWRVGSEVVRGGGGQGGVEGGAGADIGTGTWTLWGETTWETFGPGRH